jgi:glucose/arabinose dehydrogenase
MRAAATRNLVRASGVLVAVIAIGVAPAIAVPAPESAPTAGPASSLAPAALRTAVSPLPADQVAVRPSLLVGGLVAPVAVRSADDGTSRLFVVEKAGRIRIVNSGRITGTYLDLRPTVADAGEQGMLGLAFAPDFRTSGLLWVSYTRADGALVIARLRASSATAPRVSPSTRRTVLVVPHPDFTNHNGGDIHFGPDGYLYVATGDGGGSGDPRRQAQSTRSLLGKILRISVRCASKPYCIPDTNPYARSTTGARPEIWMLGLRNPWRFSFDVDRSLWIGDVGQNRYEEVTRVPRDVQRRANLGWSCKEGRSTYAADRCRSGVTYRPPTIVLCHPATVSSCTYARAGRSVTGGYVYRGTRHPRVAGTYVFGDFAAGKLWPYKAGVLGAPVRLPQVTSFGVDDAGELLAVTYSGSLYRIGFRSR